MNSNNTTNPVNWVGNSMSGWEDRANAAGNKTEAGVAHTLGDIQGNAATNLVFGDQNSPGLLGMGHRQIDPNVGNIQGQDARNQFYAQAAQGAQGRLGVTQDQTQSDQARGMQMGLAQQYQNQANGVGPSLAQNQLQQSGQQNLQQAAQMAAMGHGAGGGAMMRQAQNQRAMIGGQLGNDAANLRLNEQMQARNAQQSLYGNMRTGDMQVAGANQNAMMQQHQLNDSRDMQAMQLQQMQAQQQAQDELAREKLKQDAYSGGSGGGGGIGGVLGAVAALI